MNTRLCRIGCTESGEYEVVLDIDDERQTMLCRVIEHGGMRVVQPQPDLMSRLTFSPRLLVAAILAFDDVRKGGASRYPSP
jgi:hypothetical protein